MKVYIGYMIRSPNDRLWPRKVILELDRLPRSKQDIEDLTEKVKTLEPSALTLTIMSWQQLEE